MSLSAFLRRVRRLAEGRSQPPDSALANDCIAPHSLRYAEPLHHLCDQTQERGDRASGPERTLPPWQNLTPLP